MKRYLALVHGHVPVEAVELHNAEVKECTEPENRKRPRTPQHGVTGEPNSSGTEIGAQN
jgi:hypothetical protein